LRFEEICAGDELRAFLSKESIALPKNEIRRTRSAIPAGPGFVRNLYRGLTSGIDDVLGTSTTSMLDAVVDRLSAQATDFAGQASAGLRAEDLVGQLSSAVASAPGTATAREEGLTSFTAPICDLFITLFDLKDKNNWLRRQAILIVLQQVLGGTIERCVLPA
jgi:sorting nexin-25